jgi:Skp family chaperone for outer membrane proteins
MRPGGWGRSVVALLVMLALWPAASAAQEGAVVSQVLTLDQDRFFAGSAFGKASLAREAAESDALEAENARIERSLIGEEQDLTARRPTLPAEEFAALARAFDAKVEQIRADQDAKARAVTRRRDEDRQRFLQAAVPVLGSLLSDSGAVVILDKNTIILSLSAIDVTEAAIAKVDAALGDGSAVPAPEPQPNPDSAPAPNPDP